MIVPSKFRLGLALLLIGIGLLTLVAGTWALFDGYSFVMVDAATGASTERAHLFDIFVLQSGTLIVAVAVAVAVGLGFALVAYAKRSLERDAARLTAALKAFAAGDWEHPPRIGSGHVLTEASAAANRLAEKMRTKKKTVTPLATRDAAPAARPPVRRPRKPAVPGRSGGRGARSGPARSSLGSGA